MTKILASRFSDQHYLLLQEAGSFVRESLCKEQGDGGSMRKGMQSGQTQDGLHEKCAKKAKCEDKGQMMGNFKCPKESSICTIIPTFWSRGDKTG